MLKKPQWFLGIFGLAEEDQDILKGESLAKLGKMWHLPKFPSVSLSVTVLSYDIKWKHYVVTNY